MPGRAKASVFGSRATPAPKTTRAGQRAASAASIWSRNAHWRRLPAPDRCTPPRQRRRSRRSPRYSRCRNAAPFSWPPPRRSGATRCRLSPRAAPARRPRWAAELMARQGQEVGAERAIETGILPAACAASQWRRPPGVADQRGDGRDGLDDAGLVVAAIRRREGARRAPARQPCAPPRASNWRIARRHRRGSGLVGAGKRPPASTHACSVAATSSRSSGALSSRRPANAASRQ